MKLYMKEDCIYQCVMMYRIAHISDLHIQNDMGPVHGLVNTHEGCVRVIAEINALEQQPDIVVVTGDITHEGGLTATRHVGTLLDKLKAPYLVCLGNHDSRSDFLKVFGKPDDWSCVFACVQSRYVGGVRFLAIDSVVSDPRSSGISNEQINWLKEQFAADSKTPTVLVMHHPPFDTGVGWLDQMGLAFGREAFGEIVQNNSSILCILSGHLHRPMRAIWSGVESYAGPSVMNQIDMAPKDVVASSPDACPLILKSPPGYAIYDWVPQSGLQASTVYLDEYSEDWCLPVITSLQSVA